MAPWSLPGATAIGLTALVLAVSAAPNATRPPTFVNFHAHPPAIALTNVVNDNFLGISWELASFDTLWGSNASTVPSAMVNYLSNIHARMSGDLRIRIGGNGMDASTYDPNLKHVMLTIPDPEAYFNEIPVIFGPVLFEVLNKVQSHVGNMQFMLGASTRHPEEFGMGVKLTQDAKHMLGKSLDAILLGNEPDLYAGHGVRDPYDMKTYISELHQLVGQINSTIGDVPIGGPTGCCIWTLNDFLDNGLEDFDYKYYTMQRYPTNACGGYNEKNTNLTYYTTHTNVEEYVSWNLEGLTRSKQLGVPAIFTEYNTVSCGGSNISDTFGAAMWLTDAALQFASTNVTAAYIHTREHGILYNLFDPPTEPDAEWHTGTPYYPLLFIAEAFSSNGSVVSDLRLELADDRVAGYGIWDGAGETRGKLIFFNYAEDAPRTFAIPANASAERVAVRTLAADKLTTRQGIKWAGQTVGKNGELVGERTTEYLDCGKGCNITVPAPGIALVFVDVDSAVTDFPYDGDVAYAQAGIHIPSDDDSKTNNNGSESFAGAGWTSMGWKISLLVTTGFILTTSYL